MLFPSCSQYVTQLGQLKYYCTVWKVSPSKPRSDCMYHKLDFNVSRSSEWGFQEVAIIDNWFTGKNLHNEAPSLLLVCMHVRHIDWDFDVATPIKQACDWAWICFGRNINQFTIILIIALSAQQLSVGFHNPHPTTSTSPTLWSWSCSV